MVFGAAYFKSQRDFASKPRVARHELPWVSRIWCHNPKGVALKSKYHTMPQSLSVVYIHLVFSTKDRRPFLRDTNLRASLHAHLGEVSKRLDCPPILVGASRITFTSWRGSVAQSPRQTG